MTTHPTNGDPEMARLIDFHGNCSCGRDAHVSGDVDDDGNLRVQLETSGGRCGQVAALRPGQLLRIQAIDDDAEAAEVDELEVDELDEAEPVATSGPAAAPAAQPRRGRPPRQSMGA
jgi:hypothetical protein